MKVTRTLCILLGLVLCNTAFAEFTAPWYLGIGYGRTWSRLRLADVPTATNFNSYDNGGKVFLGYLFNDNLGTELTYYANGRVRYTIGNEVSMKSWSVAWTGVAYLPVSDTISVGVSVGPQYTRYDVPASLSFSRAAPNNTFSFGYGLFAQYLMEENAWIRAGWDQMVTYPSTVRVKPSPGMFSLSLVFDISNY